MSTIQHTLELHMPTGYRIITLLADSEMVRGTCEVNLTELHDENGEMMTLEDYEFLIDEYEAENGPDSAARVGMLHGRELQDIVAFEGV